MMRLRFFMIFLSFEESEESISIVSCYVPLLQERTNCLKTTRTIHTCKISANMIFAGANMVPYESNLHVQICFQSIRDY